MNNNKYFNFDQQNEVKEVKSKKKIKFSSILFSLIFIVLIGIIGYLTYTRIVDYKNKSNYVNLNEKQIDVNKDEAAIPAVKKDIVDKINAMLFAYDYNINAKNDNGMSYNIKAHGFNEDFIKKLDLTKSMRAYSVLKRIELNTQKVIDIPKDKISVKSIYESYEYTQDIYNGYHQVDTKDVERLYRDFYSEDIVHQDYLAMCPMYYYDKANNVYYSSYNCGGISPDIILVNIDSVYTSNVGAHAIVYFGKIKLNESQCSDGTSNCSDESGFYVYGDLDEKNMIEKINNVKLEDDNQTKYLINDSNKDKFSKYKINFKKDSEGNYYFNSIEKQ